MTGFSIQSLGKSYKDVHALKSLSFELPAGKAVALLGPNGAGKSTAIKLLVSLLAPDRGEFRWQDRNLFDDPKAIRDLVGYVSQELAMDKVLTGFEFMRFTAGILHIPWQSCRDRARQLLVELGLEEAMNRKVGTYSGGMKRRLDLATALLHQPKLLVLDEPTNGLDIEARELIWRLTTQYLNEGGSLLLVSHDFREVQELADQVIVLKEGEVALAGEPEQLKQHLGSWVVRLKTHEIMTETHIREARQVLDSVSDQWTWLSDPEILVGAFGGGDQAMLQLQGSVAKAMEQAGIAVVSLNVQKPDLEDVYRFAMGGAV